MGAPENAAGGAPATPAELLVARLPLLEKRIGELVAGAGEGAWRLVPNNGGAVGTGYGRGTIDDEGALVAVSQWYRRGPELGKETGRYGMQVWGESPLVVWPAGAATPEEVQFERPEKHKPLKPDYQKALLISRLVLSAEPVELPAAPGLPSGVRQALNLIDKAIIWLGKDGRGGSGPNWPRHF